MTTSPPGARIVVSKDGPYIVSGNAPLADQTIVTDAQGNSQSWEEGNKYSVRKGYALCRCGHSNSKPFCDGTHTKIGFDGTETASRASYLDQAKAFDGPALRLTDAEGLCASARFCDPNGKVWTQVAHTDDPAVQSNVRSAGQRLSVRSIGSLGQSHREPGRASPTCFDRSHRRSGRALQRTDLAKWRDRGRFGGWF